MLSRASQHLTASRIIHDRTGGAVLALLVHAGLFLALLWTAVGPRPQPRERTIWFNLQAHPPSTKPGRKVEQSQRLPHQPARPRSAEAPDHPAFSLPVEPDQKDLSGLRDQLFNCAPESFANLDEAQRSRCRKIGALPVYDPGAVDYADHRDQVPGAKRWARELARKNAPLLLPCGNSRRADPVYTGACVIANIANGFTFQKQYENQPAYFDEAGK
jgi:hypothetical protein